ncbi:MAG: hypothetical protein AAGA80_06475 [Cyanobacteria bacterium P01_F01_bin.143]
MTHNNLQVTKNRKEFSISSDRIQKSYRNELVGYLGTSQNSNPLTNEQICKFLEVFNSELKKFRVDGFLELDSYVTLHQVRNLWRLLKI